MPQYLGALDQGTTSTRFMIFRPDGAIVGSAQREHTQIYPQPGWVEHDPEEIWRNTQIVIEDACRSAELKAEQFYAVGITNQRETTVVWNRHTGRALCNALVWQDTRVAEDARRFAETGGQDRFRQETGLPLATYFSGLKLRWILEHVEGARALAERGDALFGTVDSFLLWQLTGGVHGGMHLTDVTNASRTQLMSLATLTWNEDLLQIFGIPRHMLPEIRSSSSRFGTVAVGPLAGVPIGSVLGDQHAAMVGQTCFQPGQVKNTYGTGCFLLMNTGQQRVASTHGLLTTVAYRFGEAPAVYALEGSIAITGALVQWVRDNLGMIRHSEEIEALAASVDDNGGVYIVPAFSGLYAPYWKDDARGIIAGLTRYANRGHLARAVLEATAFQTREVVEAMEADSGITLEQLRTDGGMVANDLLMQFQADLLNREVLRPVVRETTALGAAYAAGLSCGVYNGVEELASHWATDRCWQPRIGGDQRERLYKQWKKAVTRTFAWEEAPSAGWAGEREASPESEPRK